jgi:hypothetical protein
MFFLLQTGIKMICFKTNTQIPLLHLHGWRVGIASVKCFVAGL